MTFVHGKTLGDAISRVVSQGPVEMAVAYWGNGVCEQLGLPGNLKGYRIACDAYSGACHPKTIATLIERGATVFDVEKLHAKVYLSASEMVVTSANASDRGLTSTIGDIGLEAGIHDTDAGRIADARRWFEDIVAAGREIRPEEITAIKEAWLRNRSGRIRDTLIDAILLNSPELNLVDIRAYLYSPSAPNADHNARYNKRAGLPAGTESNEFFWGEFPGVAVDDELLCFRFERRRTKCEGVWRIREKLGEGAQAVWPSTDISRLSGGRPGNWAEIERRVTDAVKDGRLTIDGPPLTLQELAAALVIKNKSFDPLERTKNPETRRAYALLAEALERAGLIRSYGTGFMHPTHWHSASGLWLFGLIPAMNHLTFYVRGRARHFHPRLDRERDALGLPIEEKRGELRIQVHDKAEGRALANWITERL